MHLEGIQQAQELAAESAALLRPRLGVNEHQHGPVPRRHRACGTRVVKGFKWVWPAYIPKFADETIKIPRHHGGMRARVLVRVNMS